LKYKVILYKKKQQAFPKRFIWNDQPRWIFKRHLLPGAERK